MTSWPQLSTESKPTTTSDGEPDGPSVAKKQRPEAPVKRGRTNAAGRSGEPAARRLAVKWADFGG